MSISFSRSFLFKILTDQHSISRFNKQRWTNLMSVMKNLSKTNISIESIESWLDELEHISKKVTEIVKKNKLG